MLFLTCMRASEAACSLAFSCNEVLVVPSKSSLIVGATSSYALNGNKACGMAAKAGDGAAADTPPGVSGRSKLGYM